MNEAVDAVQPSTPSALDFAPRRSALCSADFRCLAGREVPLVTLSANKNTLAERGKSYGPRLRLNQNWRSLEEGRIRATGLDLEAASVSRRLAPSPLPALSRTRSGREQRL